MHTAEEKLACAKRELALRNRVYPRWVANKRMSQAKAADEIRLMAEIVKDYEAQTEAERLL
jgi:hypothetical protein